MKDNFSKEEIRQQQGMDVREIMDLLKQTYETSDGTNNNATQKWIKTRKYLYQYRARTSQNLKNKNPQGQTLSRTRKRTHGPLTLTQIHQILSFLQTTFPNHSELQAKILQNSPRILSQHHSIESRLIPTVEFLKGLYGGMPCSNGEKGGMFHEAIGRNTDLLLVRGVGYAGGGWEDQRNKDDGHELWRETDDNDSMKVEEYLRSELELTSSSIAKLKRNHPTLFQLSLANKVKPVVHHLFSLLGSSTPLEQSTDASAPISSSLSKQKKQVAKILANHPTLFFLDVRANLEPTAQFLQDSFKLNDRELATIIASTPGVLGLSLEKNLKPTIQYLWDVLKSGRIFVEADEYGEEEDASTSCLRKCVLKHPQILALSLNNIRSKVFYFDEIDRISFSGMDDANVNAINIIRDNEGQSGVDNDKLSHLGETDGASLAARILMSAPSTYSLSLKENIVPKINYLWKTWSVHSINIDETQLATECVATGIRRNECSISERLREYPQILSAFVFVFLSFCFVFLLRASFLH